jgi:hypothetical protein
MLNPMRNLSKNEKGFGAIEILLTLIFLAIIAFTGIYVAHNRSASKTASATTSSSTDSGLSVKPATSLTLAQATSQVNYVYTSYENEVINGQVLQDKTQWASNNVNAAEDLQFINKHKTWFTPAFLARMNNYETTNTSPPAGELLMCAAGSVYFDNGSFVAEGVKESGVTAKLNLAYATGDDTPAHGSKIAHILLITAKATTANIWEIDNIDLSGCGEN